MTILPKKKVEQKEEGERESSDHQHPHGGASHAHRLSGGAEARGARPRGPVAPPGEPEPLDCGPSHSKRRHRASPHRSCRKSHRASHGAGATAAAASPRSDEAGGYNSDDEHDRDAHDRDAHDRAAHDRAPEPLSPEPGFCEQGERRFEKVMKEKKGFIIKRMSEDGACLFRAAADQVYGDQDMHDVVRKHCMDYLMKNSDYFSNYVTEDFATYVNRKSMNHCHGNHIEMQAMAEMYNRTFEVYQYSTDPINTFHSIYKSDNEPIRVSYHQNAHYNSVVNPNKATIGVGLGLPSFKPGNADKTLMQSAITTSEESWIEQQMLEDKKRATDWEATNEAIEEQVARESYLQWLRDQEKNDRRPRKVTATCSSATAAAAIGIDELGGRSPRQRSTFCSSPEHQETSTESLKPASPGFSKPPSPAAGTSTHPCSPQPSSSQAHSSKDSASMTFSSPLLDCRTVMQQMSPTAFGTHCPFASYTPHLAFLFPV